MQFEHHRHKRLFYTLNNSYRIQVNSFCMDALLKTRIWCVFFVCICLCFWFTDQNWRSREHIHVCLNVSMFLYMKELFFINILFFKIMIFCSSKFLQILTKITNSPSAEVTGFVGLPFFIFPTQENNNVSFFVPCRFFPRCENFLFAFSMQAFHFKFPIWGLWMLLQHS